MASRERTGGNGHKPSQRKFCLNIRKTFSTVKVVRDWNRLARGVVESLSLEMFNT